MELLVLTPESLVGQWVTLPTGQVARVKAAYYGYLTRSGKDSIDIQDASGRRGIVLETAFTGRFQTRIGDSLTHAPIRRVMRLRRAWWAVWFALGSIPLTAAAGIAYLFATPSFFGLEGAERFDYIGIFGIALTAIAVLAGAFGALLPRKPPPPAGSGAKNMKRFRQV